MSIDKQTLRKICDQMTVTGVTPAVRLAFPKLNEPDFKFKPGGEWTAPTVWPAELAAEMSAKVESLRDAAAKRIIEEVLLVDKPKLDPTSVKMADLPPQAEKDEDGGATGNMIFRFKAPHSTIRASDGKIFPKKAPTLVDAQKKHFDRALPIWGGTECKVQYQLCPFYTDGLGVGISLRLLAVQILDLKGPQAPVPDMFEEEDGFDASGVEVPAAAAPETETSEEAPANGDAPAPIDF